MIDLTFLSNFWIDKDRFYVNVTADVFGRLSSFIRYNNTFSKARYYKGSAVDILIFYDIVS